MKSLTITLLALGALAVLSADPASAGDRIRRNSHSNMHHQLQHNQQARQQIHHNAHHYPMNNYQHRGLHQDLRHDAYHDRVSHGSYHQQQRYVPNYRGFGVYNRGFRYQSPGFSFSYYR